jgi:protease PrsW
MEFDSLHFSIAAAGGLIPALFWVWFWLKEDKRRPEPLWLMFISFIAGMAVVPAALPLQKLACDIYQSGVCQPAGDNLILIWVIVEEVLKYAAALIVVFWHKEVDEPIDLIMYMIIIALGFSALENSLFMFNMLESGSFSDSLLNGKFRFIGASLLHVLASATVGTFLAFAYYKSAKKKVLYGLYGLFIAIVLHALFNFFIMKSNGGETIIGAFIFVWIGIIILFLIIEKVKRLELTHRNRRR